MNTERKMLKLESLNIEEEAESVKLESLNREKVYLDFRDLKNEELVLVWIALIASAFKGSCVFIHFVFFFFFCFHAFLEECNYCLMNSAGTVVANVDFF